MASQKTDNELIAEFMGLPLTKQELEFSGNRELKTVPFQRWKYHESWDWLMPVVQKTFDTEFGDNFDQWAELNRKIHEALATVTIEYVHAAVVNFIKWYNEQKPS